MYYVYKFERAVKSGAFYLLLFEQGFENQGAARDYLERRGYDRNAGIVLRQEGAAPISVIVGG